MQVFYHIYAIFLKLDSPRRVFQCPHREAALFSCSFKRINLQFIVGEAALEEETESFIPAV